MLLKKRKGMHDDQSTRLKRLALSDGFNKSRSYRLTSISRHSQLQTLLVGYPQWIIEILNQQILKHRGHASTSSTSSSCSGGIAQLTSQPLSPVYTSAAHIPYLIPLTSDDMHILKNQYVDVCVEHCQLARTLTGPVYTLPCHSSVDPITGWLRPIGPIDDTHSDSAATTTTTTATINNLELTESTDSPAVTERKLERKTEVELAQVTVLPQVTESPIPQSPIPQSPVLQKHTISSLATSPCRNCQKYYLSVTYEELFTSSENWFDLQQRRLLEIATVTVLEAVRIASWTIPVRPDELIC